MTQTEQQKLGKTLWAIADQLRGAMNADDVVDFEKQMRRKVHYVIKPEFLWNNITELARTQDGDLLRTLDKGFKYIENEPFDNSSQGLFPKIV